MPSFEHSQLAKRLHLMSQPPASDVEYPIWMRMIPHLDLLATNAEDDEVILYASSHHPGDIAATTFIHAVMTKETDVTPQIKMTCWIGPAVLTKVAAPTRGRPAKTKPA